MPLCERPRLSTPGALGSGPSSVVSVHHRVVRPHPSVSQARGDFTARPLIRHAFAVRERRGDPRDLPYFHCRAVHTCRRPYAGGSMTRSRCAHVTVPGFLELPPSRHPQVPVSASNPRRGNAFRRCIVRVMLRPACLPSPPDWLRPDAAICPAPCLLRYVVTPAFHAVRRRTALGVRLDGRTGNLPPSGLSPDKSPQLVRLQGRSH